MVGGLSEGGGQQLGIAVPQLYADGIPTNA